MNKANSETAYQTLSVFPVLLTEENRVNIICEGCIEDSEYDIELFDITGQKLATYSRVKNLAESNIQISTAVSKGLYFLRVKNNSTKDLITFKIIKP